MTITGYKFVTEGMRSENDGQGWEVGKWRRHEGKLRLCKSGFHACRTPLQSLNYVRGGRWFQVEAGGRIVEEESSDKFVASEMRLVRGVPAKPALPLFAIACARRCLGKFESENQGDGRPRGAVEAAERYFGGSAEAIEVRESAELARSAGESVWLKGAGWSAAWAAWSAAAAAEAVLAPSAWNMMPPDGELALAAWGAAQSARSVWLTSPPAWSEERRWQEEELKRLVRGGLGR